MDLVVDNVGAIAEALRGRVSTLLVAQQRIMRRVAHRLRWQGVSVGLRFVESALNPADCVSRWWGVGGICWWRQGQGGGLQPAAGTGVGYGRGSGQAVVRVGRCVGRGVGNVVLPPCVQPCRL